MRWEYPYRQWVAPIVDGRIPSRRDFFEVQCKDISGGGIAFLVSFPPELENVVVGLGRSPALTYFVARVMRVAASNTATDRLPGRLPVPGEGHAGERGQSGGARRMTPVRKNGDRHLGPTKAAPPAKPPAPSRPATSARRPSARRCIRGSCRTRGRRGQGAGPPSSRRRPCPVRPAGRRRPPGR